MLNVGSNGHLDLDTPCILHAGLETSFSLLTTRLGGNIWLLHGDMCSP
jgi:hypothetical protein